MHLCRHPPECTIGYGSISAEARSARGCEMETKPRIAITYCTQCHWLLRATWMAQELLSTFSEEVGEVVLRPATGGAFQIDLDDDIIWERKRDGGFPEVKTLKQRVRDRLAPGRDLGHVDR
jgi:selenoprotein W-related protein